MSKMIKIEQVRCDDGIELVYKSPHNDKYIKLSDNYQQRGESQQKTNYEQITTNDNLNDFLQHLQLQNSQECQQFPNGKFQNLEKFNLITIQKIQNTESNIYLPFYKTIIFVKDLRNFIYVSIFNRKNNELTTYILGEQIQLQEYEYIIKSYIEKQLEPQNINQTTTYYSKCSADQVYLFAAYFFQTCFSEKIDSNITLQKILYFIELKNNPYACYILNRLLKEIKDESSLQNTAYNNYQSQIQQEYINRSKIFENSLQIFIKQLEKDYANNEKKLTLKYIYTFRSDQIYLSTDDQIIINLIDMNNQSQFIIIISKNRSNQQINLSLNSKENNRYSDRIYTDIIRQTKQINFINKRENSIKYVYFLIEKIWLKQGVLQESDLEIDMNGFNSIFDYVKKTDLMLIRNDANQLCLVLKLRQYFYGKLDDNLNFQSGVKTEQSVDAYFNYSYSEYIGQFENDEIKTNLGVSTQFNTNLEFQNIVLKTSKSENTEQTYKTTWARYNSLFNDNDVQILQINSQRFLNSSILDGWGLYLNQQNEEIFFKQSYIEEAKKFRRLLVLESFFYTYLTSYQLCERDIKLKFSEFIKFKIDIFDVYQDLCFIINKKELHWFMIKAEIIKNILIYTIYDSMSSYPEYYREYTDTLNELFSKIFQKTYCTVIQVADVYQQKDGFSCGYDVAHFLEQIHLQKTQFERLNLNEMKWKLLNIIVKPQGKT